ncbi:MAG: hypothetical protein IKI95_00420 [Clostridia bacterium]|nr:hypothetical protein [Clostridia bacterium]
MVGEQPQKQIDDKLYSQVYNYILKKGISFEDFAQKLNITSYMFNKAMDRKIKMNIYETLISKIRIIINEG